MDAMDRLVGIMARLREPGGCPWDREQTFASLRSYLLEETYEVVEALDAGDLGALREELGDLLLQVVFLSRLAEEREAFDFDAVARGIGEKLVRRHPHVFGGREAATTDDAWRHWEESKAREKDGDGGADGPRSRLDGIPRHLPALAAAHKLADRAARAGFDWPTTGAVLDKVDEEVDELRAAVASAEPESVDEELGDLLFACASLARRAGADPEGALARANRKFSERFRRVERAVARDGTAMEALSAEELDAHWQRSKREGEEPGAS